MRIQRDYYEVLGLSRSATTDEIKRRFRELARKYHPDVAGNKAVNERAFVQIATAYRTLVDPDKRQEYDLTLAGPAAGATAGAGGHQASAYHYPTSPEVDALLQQAESAYTRAQHGEAATLCQQALTVERANPRTHALLGDIYHAQGRIGSAITEYSYAVKFNPADTESKTKLEKLKKGDPAKAKKTKTPQPQSYTASKGTGTGTGTAAGTSTAKGKVTKTGAGGSSLLGKIKTLFQR